MNADTPTTEVATVGGRVITADELERRLAAIRRGPYGPRLPEDHTPAGTRLRRWVAWLLASEALVRHAVGEAHEQEEGVPPRSRGRAAEARGRPRRPRVGGEANSKETVSDAREQEEPDARLPLDRAVYALFIQVTADVTVSDSELRRYYAANPDLWTRPERRTFRHAVRPTRAEASALRTEELELPESLTRGQLTGPVEDALFAATPGSRIGPLRTVFGWHVAVLDHVEPAICLPFAEVRAAIHADLLAAARGTAFDDWLAARRDALVRFAPGYEHPGDPSLPDHVHRH